MTENNRALEAGKSCYEALEDMFKRLDEANEKNDSKLADEIQTEIDESSYGANVTKVYEITLAGGGPAVRITGELDEHDEPYTAVLEYQDWGTPWTELRTANIDTLLRYARTHYFG